MTAYLASKGSVVFRKRVESTMELYESGSLERNFVNDSPRYLPSIFKFYFCSIVVASLSSL